MLTNYNAVHNDSDPSVGETVYVGLYYGSDEDEDPLPHFGNRACALAFSRIRVPVAPRVLHFSAFSLGRAYPQCLRT